MNPKPLYKRPALVVTLALSGLALFLAFSAREWIGWQLASAAAAPVSVGPARISVPQSLPARVTFDADGDVKLVVGAISYDAMALSLELTPLEEVLLGPAAEKTLKELQLALLADEPGAAVRERRFGTHPGFVARSDVGEATSVLAVAVAGGALARLEISVRGGAPAKWRGAADDVVDSLELGEIIDRGALWAAFAETAHDTCSGGDIDACLWAARSAWQRGRLDEAGVILDKGLARVGPIEALWDEAKAGLLAAAAAAGAPPAPSAPSTPSSRRLAQAVELHLLRGELAVVRGEPQQAIELWRRAWRFGASGRVAQRLLEEAGSLLAVAPPDAANAAAWLELVRAASERFGEQPKVALAAAGVASRLGAFEVAKGLAQRVYDGSDGDDALRRAAVRVPLSAPPRLDALPCPRATKPRRVTTSMGTTEASCVDRAGRRQGPARVWFQTTGYLLEEVSYRDDEVSAPDRRYWENGQLQRQSLVDASGAVTVQRWDPFGRPVLPPEGAPSDAVLDAERP